MVQALKQRVRIGAEGKVEIGKSDLPEGRFAEVIVVLEEERGLGSASVPSRSLTSFLGTCRGQFESAERADAYLRQLRDEWDEQA